LKLSNENLVEREIRSSSNQNTRLIENFDKISVLKESIVFDQRFTQTTRDTTAGISNANERPSNDGLFDARISLSGFIEGEAQQSRGISEIHFDSFF
jgi:hypothetical protein